MEKYTKYVLGLMILILVFVGTIGSEVKAVVEESVAYDGCNRHYVVDREGYTEYRKCDHKDEDGEPVEKCPDPSVHEFWHEPIGHWTCNQWNKVDDTEYKWFQYGDLVQAGGEYYCFSAGKSMRSRGNAEGWNEVSPHDADTHYWGRSTSYLLCCN